MYITCKEYLSTKFEHNVTCCAVFVDFGILFLVSSWRQKLCGGKDQGSKMLKIILKFSEVLQCVETMSRSRTLVYFDIDYSILCPYILPLQFLLLLVYSLKSSILSCVSDSEIYTFSVDVRLRSGKS